MNHPPRDDLFDYATRRPSSGAAGLDAHLAACADCRAEVERMGFAGLLLTEADASAAGADCLGPAAIGALVDGRLSGPARGEAMIHLAACAACRAEVTAVSACLADPAVSRELATVRRRSTSARFFRMAAPLAAAAMLVVVLGRPVQNWAGGVHRSPVVSRATTPVPASPVGVVSIAPVLAWATVQGADRYRVTLFDASGAVLLETETPESSLTLPDSIVLDPGPTYLWKVEARTGWDRWVPSPLIRFQIQGMHP